MIVWPAFSTISVVRYADENGKKGHPNPCEIPATESTVVLPSVYVPE